MFNSTIYKSIKSFFVKEELFPCIVWDGKMMNYMDLTQEQIDKIRTSPEHKGWSVTVNEEKLT